MRSELVEQCMNRRTFIQSAGMLASIEFVRTASAHEVELVSAEEAGVMEPVQKLLQQNSLKQAKRLLDKHNVRYVINSRNLRANSTGDDTDSGFSAQGHYSESASEISMSLVEYSGDDEWLATGIMHLKDREYSLRDAMIIEDALGIDYDSTEWTSIDPSEENVWLACNHDAGYEVMCNMTLEDYDPNLGMAVGIDLPYYSQLTDVTLNAQTVLTRNGSTGNDDVPVKFEYKHTWAPTNVGASIDIQVDLSGLQVDLTNASVLWDDHITATPGESSGPQ